jgi:hypothetical protein
MGLLAIRYTVRLPQIGSTIETSSKILDFQPVKDKIVTLPEDYYFSSASNYAGLEYELEVILLDLF